MKKFHDFPNYDDLCRLAFQGDPRAQFLQGEVLRLGYYDQEIDESSAKVWYQKASEKGHQKARFLLNNWQNREKFNLWE